MSHLIKFSHSFPKGDRVYHITEDDIRVVLDRLPEETYKRLRTVHFNDRSQGGRCLGYVNRGRREIALCALPPRMSLTRFLGKQQTPAMFGAIKGTQWHKLAIRRFLLYDVFLDELGHLQVVHEKEKNERRKFAVETRAQEFANFWREELWAAPFSHPDPVHNPPSKEELSGLELSFQPSPAKITEQEDSISSKEPNLKCHCEVHPKMNLFSKTLKYRKKSWLKAALIFGILSLIYTHKFILIIPTSIILGFLHVLFREYKENLITGMSEAEEIWGNGKVLDFPQVQNIDDFVNDYEEWLKEILNRRIENYHVLALSAGAGKSLLANLIAQYIAKNWEKTVLVDTDTERTQPNNDEKLRNFEIRYVKYGPVQVQKLNFDQLREYQYKVVDYGPLSIELIKKFPRRGRIILLFANRSVSREGLKRVPKNKLIIPIFNQYGRSIADPRPYYYIYTDKRSSNE